MESKYIIAIVSFVLAFLLTFGCLTYINKDKKNRDKNSISYGTAYIISLIFFSVIAIISDKNDFIYEFSFFEMFFIMALAGTVFILTLYSKTQKYYWVGLLAGLIPLYFFIPDTYNIFGANYPLWLSNLAIITFFFSYCMIYKYINGIDGILILQNIFIGFSIFILFIFNLTPSIIGIFALIMAGASLGYLPYTKYPAKIKINTAAANSFAIIIAWLLLKTGEETSLSCSIIFTMFVIVEVVFAIGKRLTFMDKYKNIYANTFCYQANVKGLSEDLILSGVFKILLLMMIFGCLQVYSPNYYTVPLFCFIIVSWFLTKMMNWDVPKQTLKDINRGFIDDVRGNWDDIKKFINRD